MAVKTDLLIIGAGAVGTALARELSSLSLDILVVDRLNDVGGDASKSNSAIIHTGFDAPPGSLESWLVVRANPLYDSLTRLLDIPFRRVGAILVAVTEEEEAELPHIVQKAHENHVHDVIPLDAKEIRRMEPAVTPQVRRGLFVPRESIIDPFLLVVAQAELAARNGVSFSTNREVTGLEACPEGFRVATTAGDIEARFVVNAAGMFTDRISAMLGVRDFTVHPRRGQFHVIDRSAPVGVSRIILPVPTKTTKGRLLAPTMHGNWLMGPTAEELEDRNAHQTTSEGLAEVVRDVRKLIPGVEPSWAITQYDGLRPVRTPDGYFIRNFPTLPGYLEMSGIRSTGVTSSIAVATHARDMLLDMGLPKVRKRSFATTRTAIPCFRDADPAARQALIDADPRYAHVVCRCETVTEAEIHQAIQRPPGARDLDGIKRRVRAGLGRCQGGFCGSRIPALLAAELHGTVREVTKKGPGSEILNGETKAVRRGDA
jgi:glycerol-3-phosphate dehydrogenase